MMSMSICRWTSKSSKSSLKLSLASFLCCLLHMRPEPQGASFLGCLLHMRPEPQGALHSLSLSADMSTPDIIKELDLIIKEAS